jgi:hypothetical protein
VWHTVNALVVAMVLSFNDGRAQEQAEQNAQIQQSFMRWPGTHLWTISGIVLTPISIALMTGGGIVLTSDPRGSRALGEGLLGFGLSALVTAILMVVYNATL